MGRHPYAERVGPPLPGTTEISIPWPTLGTSVVRCAPKLNPLAHPIWSVLDTHMCSERHSASKLQSPHRRFEGADFDLANILLGWKAPKKRTNALIRNSNALKAETEQITLNSILSPRKILGVDTMRIDRNGGIPIQSPPNIGN